MKAHKTAVTVACAELGNRIRLARLNMNLTQKDTAIRAGLSVKAVQSVEAGTATLQSTVAVMHELNLADQLALLVPAPGISPVQLAKLQGRQRRRASRVAEPYTLEEQSSW